MAFPMRRVWIGVTTRVGLRKTGEMIRALRSSDHRDDGRFASVLMCFPPFFFFFIYIYKILIRVGEAEEGGEHVRVRRRTRDVGAAEEDGRGGGEDETGEEEEEEEGTARVGRVRVGSASGAVQLLPGLLKALARVRDPVSVCPFPFVKSWDFISFRACHPSSL